jgi:hypothetical protein
MSRDLLTHHELAEKLGLAVGTIRNIWRTLPYIAITPTARFKPHLRGVRFVYEDVLEYCRNNTIQSGGCHGREKNTDRLGPPVRGLFQVPGAPNHQTVHSQGGCCGVGGGGKESPAATDGPTLRFDVFAGV